MPETPSHDNRAFWIDQIIAGVIFAAGFDIMRDHLVLGVIVSALGLGWLVYLRWERKRMTPLVRTPNVLAVAVLVLATAVMGYDIYDRGDGRSSFPSNCVNYQYTEIDSHQFSHETVRLDGRKFVNCSFDNVTFKFEGTAPFQFIPYPPVTIADIKVRSDVPVVKGSFNVCLLGCKPSSVDNSPTIP